MRHVPVLTREVLEILQPGRGGLFIDATAGNGGHSRAILENSPADLRLIAIDRNPATLGVAAEHLEPFQNRVRLLQGDFRDLAALLPGQTPGTVEAILYDLGLSSFLLDQPDLGLSFQRDDPLDMRFDPGAGFPAYQLLAETPEPELADLFYQLGEIRESRRLAARIKSARPPVQTTGQLAAIARSVIRRRGRIDPATRVFQALRIAVNDELDALRETLPQAEKLLAPGGRLAVISYHSLEDRIVKNFLRESRELERLTRKPIQPSEAERRENPASRSAKLRGARKLPEAVFLTGK
ncbi:MAG TPA: 16S rRNA (cytosine(1402)-N(4))-methyltransferase RsmH [bacterium]|uniref:Ribosomal RNA small subunit methyltransferase H n=1 Tax=candidate division TA06 bacterium ADurb.Bin417 TaxID=1852828 RepID=A0A1V5MKJ8_UNCT6|nr:MAG: Ribosomal RNA small subunit methyltransferase H [candidate division TA06 bacterium ADurb.Bin417]HNQ36086.1 16S rRNA (cytosine(1402)-N(4))-methyltransferase RsmH [bacterium]